MKQNRIEEGRLTDRGQGLGTATEETVMQRAGEIAVINGRSRNNVLTSDIDQARRELQGMERSVPNPTAADLIPEEDRWEPGSISKGGKTDTLPAFDEQTVAEKLVDE